ncbi:glutamate--tRNA ligase [Candidatus Marinamargulisbacteria bacterium SCGC AG-414-C22]|nr:glutamate--tRNA ligase [Candidatus Marinamargulisbacteria bacterium SCGC AG-414-C22]
MRVRFAPSPTGNLHIGTLRAALFNWLYTKANQGSFILRIEDTDLKRSDKQYEQNIFEGLSWLGLTVDEGPQEAGDFGPYRQAERIEKQFYQKAAQQLLAEKKAYYCFLTDDDIASAKQIAKDSGKPYIHSRESSQLSASEIESRIQAGHPYTIRFKMTADRTITFKDIIRNPIDFDCAIVSDFVIMKSDGSPSYNFAVVVDDAAMNISHVIRGEDHISNMPKQLALYEAMGYEAPQFAHLPMILGPDKSKLSKRHGATAVTDYRDQGFLPDALFNYLALLGWSPKDEQELLSKEAIIAQFGIDRVNKSNAVFDIQKLTWMNGQYIRQLSAAELHDVCFNYLTKERQEKLLKLAPELQEKAVFAVRDNLDVLSDINQYIDVFIESDDDFLKRQRDLSWKETDKTVLHTLKQVLITEQCQTTADYEACLESILEQTQLGKGKVFKPIRLAITAQGSGPHIADLLACFGMEKILERVNYSL